MRIDSAGGRTFFLSKNESYEEFVNKFKPKKTTDDCYTPPAVYEIVCEWACGEYGIDPGSIVRPFYPGGDYENYKYKDGCVVLDNPPFSILSKIIDFYLDRKIPFFLFAPSLTALAGKRCCECNHIFCNSDIVYENGAIVRTAFITTFGDEVARTAADLGKLIKNVQKNNAPQLPKYAYPDNVLTASMMQKYASRGVDFRVKRGRCVRIAKLDSMVAQRKAIYGGGLLLSDKAAAEKAAAEKAAADKAAADKEGAIVWELSDREKRIIHDL